MATTQHTLRVKGDMLEMCQGLHSVASLTVALFSTYLRKLMKNTHAALLRFINKVRKCSSCLQRLR